MRNIDTILIHCSATPAGKDFTVADIDGWHRARGFDRVGIPLYSDTATVRMYAVAATMITWGRIALRKA